VNPSSTFADKEIILRLLRRAERRTRLNRLARELTFGFAVVLTIPIALKTWDLFSPLTTTTVTVALAVCLVAFLAYAVLRIFRKASLFQAAASVDEKANLYDAMTSASWFIYQKETSKWIDAHLKDTARNAATINLAQLYPHVIPRETYFAAAMCLLFVGLNFVPLSLNHNWLKVRSAPEGIPPQLVNLMRPPIDEALKQMAMDLHKSEKSEGVAEALMKKKLSEAANELRKLAQEMKHGRSDSSEAMERLQQSLDQASKHSTEGLEQLSKDLAKASQGLKNQNRQIAQQGLENAANDLEKLDQNMSRQQPQNSAGNKQDENQPDSGRQQQSPMAGGQSRQAADKKDDSKSDGTGMDPSASPPHQGERTTLEVQLEQERLAGMPSGGGIPEDIHESSKQQTSRLEYSNVQSELNASRKDLMNRDGIPWEYRPLVKGYMQAIRPK
jgi:hypothetical protein